MFSAAFMCCCSFPLFLFTTVRNCGIFEPALVFDSESSLCPLHLQQVCQSGSETPCRHMKAKSLKLYYCNRSINNVWTAKHIKPGIVIGLLLTYESKMSDSHYIDSYIKKIWERSSKGISYRNQFICNLWIKECRSPLYR